MCAVPVIVVWMFVIIEKIIAGYETCIGQVRGLYEVFIRFISDAGVHHGDDNIRIACCDIPGRFQIDTSAIVTAVGIGTVYKHSAWVTNYTGPLESIVEMPLVIIVRIVGWIEMGIGVIV